MRHQPISDSLFAGRLNTGRGSNANISGTNSENGSPPLNSEIPLLTYGEEVYISLNSPFDVSDFSQLLL